MTVALMRKYCSSTVCHVPTPPNYSKAPPGFDRFCGVCIYYDNGRCTSYGVPVNRDFTCWACVRNYSVSAKQASSMQL